VIEPPKRDAERDSPGRRALLPETDRRGPAAFDAEQPGFVWRLFRDSARESEQRRSGAGPRGTLTGSPMGATGLSIGGCLPAGSAGRVRASMGSGGGSRVLVGVWDDPRVRIGYAYVGGEDREGLESQLAALRAAGCRKCFADAGGWVERPELARALAALVDGRDCLVVCRLDRVGRSLPDLVATLAGLEERRVGVCSLQDGIDTESAGEGTGAVFRALARFEHVLPRERTLWWCGSYGRERAGRGCRRVLTRWAG
jgi:Resolvase, N terminal domain